MPLSMSFLCEVEIDLIEQSAFRVMDEIGMQVDDTEILSIMARAGARVDEHLRRVRLSESQIREAIASTPSEIRLTSSTDREILVGHNGRKFWGSLVIDPIVVDYHKGPRPPHLSDVSLHARIGDALPRVDFIYLMDNLYSDVPPAAARALSIAEFMGNVTKHMICAPMTPADARIWLDMAEIAAGRSTLAEKPLLGVTASPLSPLRIDHEVGQTLRMAVERGATIWALSMPLVGVSGPFTLAGTATLQLAETFFMATLIQTMQPGIQMVSCAGSWPVNLATGSVSPGAAERLVVSAGMAEVHRRYGWPTYNGSFSTDVITLDPQNGAERLLQALVALSPVDMLLGMGSLGAGNGVSAEMIVMDHDLLDTLDRVQAGMRVDAQTVAFEAIQRAGPGGDFTADELTLELLRSGEYYFGGSFDRPSKPGEETGWHARAHERVKQIAATHQSVVPQAIRDDLERYVRKATAST